ncbi:MAG: precorrin-6y C5,15-methyltransferase (decarboxylating) subunit CbiE [Synergistaceae bacterium]|jgi:precorrin-6Y C5,15-methyltransferase (decarboxylating)|nr:precorrin-6y C5,15-methyltransferase (decarboxylating) subunit CbiE [Synergistaceae bacterium]
MTAAKYHRLSVVGLGCGSPELLNGQALAALRQSETVFAAERLSGLLSWHSGVIGMKDIASSLDEIELRLGTCDVAVAVSGDPGIFSLLGLLKSRFGESLEDLSVVPGISSMQYFFAELRESWNDAAIISAHGRSVRCAAIMRTVSENRKTVIFCDLVRNPEWICGILTGYMNDFAGEDERGTIRVAIGENLSCEGQRVLRSTAEGMAELVEAEGPFSFPSIVAVFNDAPIEPAAGRPRDADFIRSGVPMTRQEVRSAVLDELDLSGDSIVWDIGSGSGSVAVACSMICRGGEAHAVERSREAVDLIRRNRKKFRCFNLNIHEGSAPDILNILPESPDSPARSGPRGLPVPTRVFVGGSGGRLRDILTQVAGFGAGIKVVVSAVTLETIAEASGMFMNSDLFTDPEVLSISAARSRPLGGSSLLAAQNPVMLWSSYTTGKKDEKM